MAVLLKKLVFVLLPSILAYVAQIVKNWIESKRLRLEREQKAQEVLDKTKAAVTEEQREDAATSMRDNF